RQKVSEQLRDRLLDGDYYSTPAGNRHLFRLAGAMAVRLHPQFQKPDAVRTLTAAGGSLVSYRLDAESPNGLLIFKASPSERQQQQREPLRLRQALAIARRAAAVRSANPVLIEAETRLAR